MKSLVKRLLQYLPDSTGRQLRRIYHSASFFVPGERTRLLWLRDDYSRFAMEQREYIFRSIARFCNLNRPSNGYYFEFGCHGANTMRMCWKHTRYLFDWTYVGFDSFEGLPEIADVDQQAIWAKGKLSTAEDEFVGLVMSAEMPRESLATVRGFYDQSLTTELIAKLSSQKAAVVYIDCDLYASTVPVLEFVRSFLREGTVLVFDDWFCFNGSPEKGEQRAWREFRLRYPEIQFVDFVHTNEAKSFICVRP